jgi:hypothetical protein
MIIRIEFPSESDVVGNDVIASVGYIRAAVGRAMQFLNIHILTVVTPNHVDKFVHQ